MPRGNLSPVKAIIPLAASFALAFPVFAAEKEKPKPPLVIPVTGAAQSTTTKLGNSYVTRSPGSQSFSTTQLGSSTITRDFQGQHLDNHESRQQLCDAQSRRTAADHDQAREFIRHTRLENRLHMFTKSPLGNSLQTRGPGGSSYSATPLGNSFVTRGTATKKDEPKGARVIVVPARK